VRRKDLVTAGLSPIGSPAVKIFPVTSLFLFRGSFIMEVTHWSSQQETQWIDKARAGDLPAFNQLVLSHQDAAFRIAKWMVNDEASAEDIVQAAFLSAFLRIGSFRSYNFRAWLLRMVRNACIDELRRRKRHPCLTLEALDVDSESMEMAQWPIDARQTPEETFLQHEAWEWIERCLHRLPGPMREVMVLIDFECFDYAEAANIIGVALGTLKSRLGRARARMRHILCEENLEPEYMHALVFR
jgi:RNA polymerase sigma-70 factor (ECF subfamily)